jgi:hypothetical protein
MTKRRFPDRVLRRTFSEEQKSHFVSMYLSEGGTTKAARVCGVTPQIIWKYAKSAGVLRDYFKTVDHDYFSVIDNERKAYWLGMLMADGNVCVNKVVKKILDSLYGGIEVALPRKWEAANRARTYTPSGHFLGDVKMGCASTFSRL